MKKLILPITLTFAAFSCYANEGLSIQNHQNAVQGSNWSNLASEGIDEVYNDVFSATWTDLDVFSLRGTYPGGDIVRVYYEASYEDGTKVPSYVDLRGGADLRYIRVDRLSLIGVKFMATYQERSYNEFLPRK